MIYKYLFYSSLSNIDDVNIFDILNISRSENKKHDITGFLVSHFSGFYQLIEGNEADIDQLYSNIFKDNRHHHVNMMISGYHEKRFFPDWQMGYLSIDHRDALVWSKKEDEAEILKSFIDVAYSSLIF